MTIKERGCYVVIKWLVNGREWTSNSKFTSKTRLKNLLKKRKDSSLM